MNAPTMSAPIQYALRVPALCCAARALRLHVWQIIPRPSRLSVSSLGGVGALHAAHVELMVVDCTPIPAATFLQQAIALPEGEQRR